MMMAENKSHHNHVTSSMELLLSKVSSSTGISVSELDELITMMRQWVLQESHKNEAGQPTVDQLYTWYLVILLWRHASSARLNNSFFLEAQQVLAYYEEAYNSNEFIINTLAPAIQNGDNKSLFSASWPTNVEPLKPRVIAEYAAAEKPVYKDQVVEQKNSVLLSKTSENNTTSSVRNLTQAILHMNQTTLLPCHPSTKTTARH